MINLLAQSPVEPVVQVFHIGQSRSSLFTWRLIPPIIPIRQSRSWPCSHFPLMHKQYTINIATNSLTMPPTNTPTFAPFDKVSQQLWSGAVADGEGADVAIAVVVAMVATGPPLIVIVVIGTPGLFTSLHISMIVVYALPAVADLSHLSLSPYIDLCA